MPHGRAVGALLVAMIFAGGCGLAYQAASEHRAGKMEQVLTPGLTMSEVHQKFGEPDIEDKSDDSTTEIWSYAKHANSNDLTAELFCTSAKEGDVGTFEDLKFADGKLVSWGEGRHTMAAKEGSEITTTFSYGRGGGRHGNHGMAGTPDTSSGSSDSSEPSHPANPLSVTF